MALDTAFAASLYAAFNTAKSSAPSAGNGAPNTDSVRAGVAKDHIVKKANQLKNCTAPSFRITTGMSRMKPKISVAPAPTPWLCSFSRRNASMSSGGSSVVVKTVIRMLVKNTKAPTAKETNTLWGISPAPASLDTPSWVTNHGRFDATHVPMPMIKVCNTNP